MKKRKKDSAWLIDYAENIYSQAGEDGVIEKILEILPEKNNWCVEFGAWDGILMSNTAALIDKNNYKAVLIEGSKLKYRELCGNYVSNKNVITLNKMVGFSTEDNLDHSLKMTEIPKSFDLLSIDIDGNDYHVWKAMSSYMPKVVVIEFNQTIPTEVEFVQEANPSITQGSSLLSLVKLGKEKGYELISVLPFNAFFVKNEYYDLFEIENNSAFMLRKSLIDVTYIFTGFDGKVFLSGSMKLPWHGLSFKESKVQQIPKLIQKFPSNYNKTERILWYLNYVFQLFLENPVATVNKARKKLGFIADNN